MRKLKGRPSSEEQAAHQEHLLAVSRDEFLANGYNATSIDAIARKAGISKLTIYRRFAGKEGLFLAVADRVVLASTRLPDVRTDDRPPAEVLAEFASAILEGYLAPESLAIIRLVITEALQFPEVARRYYEQAVQTLEPLVRYLAALDGEGVLVIGDPPRAALTFTSLCMDGVRFLIMPAPAVGEPRQAWCRDVTRIFLEGHRRRE